MCELGTTCVEVYDHAHHARNVLDNARASASNTGHFPTTLDRDLDPALPPEAKKRTGRRVFYDAAMVVQAHTDRQVAIQSNGNGGQRRGRLTAANVQRYVEAKLAQQDKKFCGYLDIHVCSESVREFVFGVVEHARELIAKTLTAKADKRLAGLAAKFLDAAEIELDETIPDYQPSRPADAVQTPATS